MIESSDSKNQQKANALLSLCHNFILPRTTPPAHQTPPSNWVSGTTIWPYPNSLTLESPEGKSLALRNSLASSSTGLRQERFPKTSSQTLTRRRSKWQRPTFENQKCKLSKSCSVIRAPSFIVPWSIRSKLFAFSYDQSSQLCTDWTYKTSFIKEPNARRKSAPASTQRRHPATPEFRRFSPANAPFHRCIYLRTHVDFR